MRAGAAIVIAGGTAVGLIGLGLAAGTSREKRSSKVPEQRLLTAHKTEVRQADKTVGKLGFPVRCSLGEECAIQNYVDRDPSPEARDFTGGSRTYDGHNGTDIRLKSMDSQRDGVPVLAAAAGRVLRARDKVPDVSVRDLPPGALAGQECGNGVVIDHGDGLQTQYCHLAEGSIKVKPGQQVAAGTPIGDIGLSGQTEYPHLHFTVRKDGQVIDPFAPGETVVSSSDKSSLWTSTSGLQDAYAASEVLNAGFATAPVTMEDVVEHGSQVPPRPSASAPALVAYVQAIGLRKGDVQQLEVIDPGRKVLAKDVSPPLKSDQAQSLFFVGKKRPVGGWSSGSYEGRYSITRGGKTVLDQRFQLAIR